MIVAGGALVALLGPSSFAGRRAPMLAGGLIVVGLTLIGKNIGTT